MQWKKTFSYSRVGSTEGDGDVVVCTVACRCGRRTVTGSVRLLQLRWQRCWAMTDRRAPAAASALSHARIYRPHCSSVPGLSYSDECRRDVHWNSCLLILTEAVLHCGQKKKKEEEEGDYCSEQVAGIQVAESLAATSLQLYDISLSGPMMH